MKLSELFESSKETFHIDNEDGSLVYGWNTELEAEESKGYIPKGYDKKVLELQGIFANEFGQGQGDRLMKKFMSSEQFKKAELVFLDPVPNIGIGYKSGKSDDDQIAALKKFYSKYGFRSNGRNNRMWLVLKGSIPDNKLPA